MTEPSDQSPETPLIDEGHDQFLDSFQDLQEANRKSELFEIKKSICELFISCQEILTKHLP